MTTPEYLSACVRCSTKDRKVHQHLENRFRHEGKSMFWRFILHQTVNRDFLIHLQWYTVPTDWTWTFSTCGRCSTKDQKTLQHLEKWFHREGNSVFWPWYWITPLIHTFWAHCSGIWSWLAPAEYQSTHGICFTTDHKSLRNLEPSIAMNINWYSGHFHLAPWLHTFLPSGTEWRLIPPGHPFAHDRCASKDQKTR